MKRFILEFTTVILVSLLSMLVAHLTFFAGNQDIVIPTVLVTRFLYNIIRDQVNKFPSLQLPL